MKSNENTLQLLSALGQAINTSDAAQVTVVIVQINKGVGQTNTTIQSAKLIEGDWESLQPGILSDGRLLEAAPQNESADDSVNEDDDVVYDQDEFAAEEPETFTRAQNDELTAALRGALTGKQRLCTPPSLLASRYQRFEVEAFDGTKLTVTPRYTRYLDSGLDTAGKVQEPTKLERAEAPLRELLKEVLAETDERAEGLFRKALGCSVKDAQRTNLEPLSRVFLGRGSPAEIAKVLALVDRYQVGSFEREERESALAEYYQTHLGLSADGFALSYFRGIHGSSSVEQAFSPKMLRGNTDDLAVGDLVFWGDGQVAVVEKVFNLFSRATRIEVFEMRGGLQRATYHLQQSNKPGVYLATSQSNSGEVKISAPL